MESGKIPNKFLGVRNNKIYMDLKLIIREHALQFLPAKSLFKFRGVCRDWKLIISTPFFAHNQSLSFRSLSGLFLQTPGTPPTFVSLDPNSAGIPDPALKFLPAPTNILASSNGLLCCQALTGDRAYYICNPVTSQFKKLPKPSFDHGRDPAVVLIFNPSLLNFVAEFTLVCAFRSADFDDGTEFEIYSSKTDAWTVSGEINFAAKKLVPKSGVTVNDCAYWQTYNGGILAFDLVKNRSQVIHGCHYGGAGCLGEMNGKLCNGHVNGHTMIVSVISNIYSNTMQMSSHARLWDDKVRIQLSNEVFDGNANDDLFSVLHVESDFALVLGRRNVYRFDLKTKEIKFVVEAAQFDRKGKGIPYVNSLVAL
ncbi:F-box only protein 6 [Lactuca sativa]|uniref:F-box only protein 6 n=1 Tax=Lactuca sativa TaxID=4236 RepID=UPI000CC07A28|nr:F-box only protein 6 [Lactuca sativa]